MAYIWNYAMTGLEAKQVIQNSKQLLDQAIEENNSDEQLNQMKKLSFAYYYADEYQTANKYVEDTMDAFTKFGQPQKSASLLALQAWIQWHIGDLDSITLFDKARATVADDDYESIAFISIEYARYLTQARIHGSPFPLLEAAKIALESAPDDDNYQRMRIHWMWRVGAAMPKNDAKERLKQHRQILENALQLAKEH